MDAVGLSVASSASTRDPSSSRRHVIEFLPWLRHFRLTFYPGGEATPLIGFIHETQVKSWEPIE